MQPYRLTVRNVPRGAACGRRNLFAPAMAPHHHHPFFGGGSSAFNPAAEFNGLVRLLDSAAAEFFPAARHGAGARRTSFNPRFDVREVENGYELKGELPGVNHGDLQIEFEDERTLVIRGSTRRESTESNVKAVENNAAEAPKAVEGAADANDDAASVHSDKSSNYRKASVEDEYVDAGAEAADKATEREKPTTTASNKVAPAPEQEEPQFKYWVSERSVGEFERRFAFPGRVDQDAVTASLKNGILSVVVPKIVDKATRKIEVQ